MCRIVMNNTRFQVGDTFYVAVFVENNTSRELNVQQFFALDVYGQYFFDPSWQETIDFRRMTIAPGYFGSTEMFNFIWPTGAGSAENLHLYLVYLDETTQELVGNWDMRTFGYH